MKFTFRRKVSECEWLGDIAKMIASFNHLVEFDDLGQIKPETVESVSISHAYQACDVDDVCEELRYSSH